MFLILIKLRSATSSPRSQKHRQNQNSVLQDRKVSVLVRELTEESDQFLFLRAVCLVHLKGSVGLILVKTWEMIIDVALDLWGMFISSRVKKGEGQGKEGVTLNL